MCLQGGSLAQPPPHCPPQPRPREAQVTQAVSPTLWLHQLDVLSPVFPCCQNERRLQAAELLTEQSRGLGRKALSEPPHAGAVTRYRHPKTPCSTSPQHPSSESSPASLALRSLGWCHPPVPWLLILVTKDFSSDSLCSLRIAFQLPLHRRWPTICPLGDPEGGTRGTEMR